MKVKATDLSELVRDMVAEAIDTDSYQYERTCKFIINYATNGGHQGRAARDAGFPPAGADAQVSKLLKNDKILNIVNRVKEHVFVADNFVSLLSKNHIIHLHYQLAMKYIEKSPSQAVNALKEIAALSGWYMPVDDKNNEALTPDIVKAMDTLKEHKEEINRKLN